ncbi:MAG: type II toxin-antitoxin system PemK/MazF family toxin [Spirochaetes bacterium]|nr:type II toxin-antitoxin system PemK/MazF family toxin [Spirochaetota bacterium]
MKHSEIRWYKFQSPDKKRPVLILTRDSIIDYLSEITIAPITSTIRNIPTEVFLSINDGISKDCVINLDHIQTVSKSKIGSLITTLSYDKRNQVKDAIIFAFGF